MSSLEIANCCGIGRSVILKSISGLFWFISILFFLEQIVSDIDPSYEITKIIRSHRVGKPDEQAAAVVKHRQIIVCLSDTGVKFRILK
jgi:hypothetical protein